MAAPERKRPRRGAGQGGARYHCDYCSKDITRAVRIKCAVCRDFDLCVECFSVGVEIKSHKNDHAYRVVVWDHMNFPLYSEDWGAEEELLLLEAIEMYGLCNWGDVAEHVGSKAKRACEEHYFTIYMGSKPVRTKVKPSLQLIGATAGATATTSAGATPGTPAATESTKTVKISFQHLAGWMPLRGDFDVEHDNDSEILLAGLSFYDDDSPEDFALKIRVLEIYWDKLRERAKRKQFVLSRGKLDIKELERSSTVTTATTSTPTAMTKEERDISLRSRVFARFWGQEEHDKFVEGLIEEARLRNEINKLAEWRLVGLTDPAQGPVYQADVRRRNSRHSGVHR
eukprot:gnl/Spiro4/2452_TR1176_c0_g1_i1.p1 gnl/Spiro4/2452_TR1176_c0_g1~~gnl/Spiro4/2452_TR1176_c0_g1_i1.p1  ORF type:complete len:342 (-),score=51.43 gnl/Spiro4/2452_TR1176_c0_g1_i1:10-1035(-)